MRQRLEKRVWLARMMRERMERWRDISIGKSVPACTASITVSSSGSRIWWVLGGPALSQVSTSLRIMRMPSSWRSEYWEESSLTTMGPMVSITLRGQRRT